MKTKEEIRATTTGKIPRPANYRYGEKLKEWDASLPAGVEADILLRAQPLHDRLIVRLIEETPPPGAIIVIEERPLIGGKSRKAVVLKCGPGRWIEGEWWKVGDLPRFMDGYVGTINNDDMELNSAGLWQWFPGYRRPIAVNPGQTVYIGNWVDLEADGLALCQEGDIRGYV